MRSTAAFGKRQWGLEEGVAEILCGIWHTMFRKEKLRIKFSARKNGYSLIRRFSSKRQGEMILHGIEREVVLEMIDEEFLPILLTGELVHVGKNSRFGFGKFQVK